APGKGGGGRARIQARVCRSREPSGTARAVPLGSRDLHYRQRRRRPSRARAGGRKPLAILAPGADDGRWGGRPGGAAIRPARGGAAGGVGMSVGRRPRPGWGRLCHECSVMLALILVLCVTAVCLLTPGQPDKRPVWDRVLSAAWGLLQCFGLFLGASLVLAS